MLLLVDLDFLGGAGTGGESEVRIGGDGCPHPSNEVVSIARYSPNGQEIAFVVQQPDGPGRSIGPPLRVECGTRYPRLQQVRPIPIGRWTSSQFCLLSCRYSRMPVPRVTFSLTICTLAKRPRLRVVQNCLVRGRRLTASRLRPCRSTFRVCYRWTWRQVNGNPWLSTEFTTRSGRQTLTGVYFNGLDVNLWPVRIIEAARKRYCRHPRLRAIRIFSDGFAPDGSVLLTCGGAWRNIFALELK